VPGHWLVLLRRANYLIETARGARAARPTATALRACELAEIKPKFEKRNLNGQDARALIVSLNIVRRNLKAGQKAMAFALLYPEAKRGGVRRKGASSESELGFSKVRLSDARAVLAHSRELAEDVLRDTKPLDEALKIVKTAREQASSVEARRSRQRK
jgi:hypothetical protein